MTVTGAARLGEARRCLRALVLRQARGDPAGNEPHLHGRRGHLPRLPAAGNGRIMGM